MISHKIMVPGKYNREEYKTWSQADVNLHMNQNGSFTVIFFGYEKLGRTAREFELRLDKLASVEVWSKWDAEEGFNPFIQFNENVINRTQGIGI